MIASPQAETSSRPICYGYGRHSTAKQDMTRKVQHAKVKAHWRNNLKRKGVKWGGFYYDRAVQGKKVFSEREQGREVYAIARPKDYIIVARLDRAFRSVANGVSTIQALQQRKVRFISLDLMVNTATPMGKFFVSVLLAVAELERDFASERTSESIAFRKKNGLPVGKHAPVGWRIVGKGVRDSGLMKSTRRFVVDHQERLFVEAIYSMRRGGQSYAAIATWAWTQKQYENKRRMDNIKAVQWAVAAKELDFPKVADGKKVVRKWRRTKGRT